MKKFAYLCAMIMLSLNMMAQIDLNDSTWKMVFHDEFTENGRYWQNWISRPDKKWRGYSGWNVIDGANWYQIYQYSNCLFCPAEGTMKLVGEYCDTIWKNNYQLPGWMGNDYPSSDSLFYFSGEIDARRDSTISDTMGFRFGYFEIRCKLPKHEGAHPGFWLHGANTNSLDPYYEAIDIVEYSWSAGDPRASDSIEGWLSVPNPNATYAGDPRTYSTAIAHNLHGQSINFHTDVYSMNYPRIPNNQEDINGWHIYSCEWMPDHVYWFLDGNLVNSYYNQSHIPSHSLILKTNYGIDSYAVHRVKDSYGNNVYNPVWMDSDTLTIDYIRVYQLNWDCDTDEMITCQNELKPFDAVKRSISIASVNENIVVGNTEKITFRVSESFEITGPFQADSGCEFTVIRQDCPE